MNGSFDHQPNTPYKHIVMIYQNVCTSYTSNVLNAHALSIGLNAFFSF